VSQQYTVVQQLPFRLIFFVVLFSLATSAPLARQLGGKKSLKASYATVAPVIDGSIEDDVWKAASFDTDFTQAYPKSGKKPSLLTGASIAFDDQNIYVAIQCLDQHPDSIVSRLTARDAQNSGDYVGFVVDSYGDMRDGYLFEVAASGSRRDEALFEDGNVHDASWDGMWDASVHFDSTGWSTELRIPFSELHISSDTNVVVHVNVERHIGRYDELIYWSPVDVYATRFLSFSGELVGLQRSQSVLNARLIPQFSVISPFPADKVRAYRSGSDTLITPKIGFDLLYQPTSSIKMHATVLPDFSLVEVDPAIVDLSTYETYLPEKRIFFLEDAEFLRFAGESFYTRRVGSANSRFATHVHNRFDLANIEQYRSRLLGALKLVGRLENRIRYGIFSGFTDEEFHYVRHDGTESSQLLHASYNVARLRCNPADELELGGFGSITALQSVSFDLSAGTNATVRLANQGLDLSGSLLYAQNNMREAAMDHGTRGRISFSSTAGTGLGFRVEHSFVSRDFDNSSIGYFERNNIKEYEATISYRSMNAVAGTISQFGSVTYTFSENYDRVLLSRTMQGSLGVLFQSLDVASVDVGYSGAAFDDRETRGGSLFLRPRSALLGVHVGTDRRRTIFGALGGTMISYSRNYGRQLIGSGFISGKILSNVEATTSVFMARSLSQIRFLSPGADSLGSRIDLFSRLTSTTLQLDLRSEWTISNQISFIGYAVLTKFSGTFTGLSVLLAPGQLLALPQSPVFSILSTSLRFTLSGRWQFTEGGNVYLVITRKYNAQENDTPGSISEKVSSVFGAPSDTYIGLKFSLVISI
jgi:hypothetical protein